METIPNAYKYGFLFGSEPVAESEKARVLEELAKIGGLTFDVKVSNEGWVAQANELPSLIAGNTNPNPSDLEIKSEIRSTIFAAFDIKTGAREIETPLQEFKYSLQMA